MTYLARNNFQWPISHWGSIPTSPLAQASSVMVRSFPLPWVCGKQQLTWGWFFSHCTVPISEWITGKTRINCSREVREIAPPWCQKSDFTSLAISDHFWTIFLAKNPPYKGEKAYKSRPPKGRGVVPPKSDSTIFLTSSDHFWKNYVCQRFFSPKKLETTIGNYTPT